MGWSGLLRLLGIGRGLAGSAPHGANHGLGQRLLGAVEHVDGGAGLDDPAPLEHDEMIGEATDDAHVVGRDEH